MKDPRTDVFSSSDILASPAALQIRQLEALQSMSRSANAKVIFVPMNLFNAGDAQSSFSNSGSQSLLRSLPQC